MLGPEIHDCRILASEKLTVQWAVRGDESSGVIGTFCREEWGRLGNITVRWCVLETEVFSHSRDGRDNICRGREVRECGAWEPVGSRRSMAVGKNQCRTLLVPGSTLSRLSHTGRAVPYSQHQSAHPPHPLIPAICWPFLALRKEVFSSPGYACEDSGVLKRSLKRALLKVLHFLIPF